jgi:plasmid stabilization system protein ParE
MKYRVVWAPNAESDLEAILGLVARRTETVKAAREIDSHLLSNPHAFGESRVDQIRIGFVLPLGIEYEVFDDVRTVIVHSVWRISSRSDS